MSTKMKLPRPNLQGDYQGSCIGCLKGTDTGFATEGEAEFHIAAVNRSAGVPFNEAEEMLRLVTGADPGKVIDGEYVQYWRLCGGCAQKTGTQVGLIAVGQAMPAYRQSVMFPNG